MPNFRITLGDPKAPESLKVIEWGDDLVTFSEAEKVERVWGSDWPSFVQAVHRDNARALRTLIWSLMARETPGLSYEKVDLPRGHFSAQPICVVCGQDLALVMIDAKRKMAEKPEDEKAPGWVHEHGYVMCEAPKPEPAVKGPKPLTPTKAARARKRPSPSASSASNTNPPSPTSSESDPGSGTA